MSKRNTETKMRRCPKCGGNLYLDADEHNQFEHCLQCGYMADLVILVQTGNATRIASRE